MEFVAGVVPQGTAGNDYGPERPAYAVAEVPLYLAADPYQARAACSRTRGTAPT
ncbi:hypothetical protein [Streptomyces shaanxiensis]